MPCGPHIHRKAVNGFIPERKDTNLVSFIWLDYVAATEGLVITHRLSAGREVTVMGNRVDGFAEKGGTTYVFEFDGCWLVIILYYYFFRILLHECPSVTRKY